MINLTGSLSHVFVLNVLYLLSCGPLSYISWVVDRDRLWSRPHGPMTPASGGGTGRLQAGTRLERGGCSISAICQHPRHICHLVFLYLEHSAPQRKTTGACDPQQAGCLIVYLPSSSSQWYLENHWAVSIEQAQETATSSDIKKLAGKGKGEGTHVPAWCTPSHSLSEQWIKTASWSTWHFWVHCKAL